MYDAMMERLGGTCDENDGCPECGFMDCVDFGDGAPCGGSGFLSCDAVESVDNDGSALAMTGAADPGDDIRF